MRMLVRSAAALLVVSMAVACGSQKAPAETALKAAQDAYAKVSADAQKYVPDQAKSIQDTLAAAQTSFTNGDYAAVLTQVQGIPAKVGDLTSAIAAKKAELARTWTDLSGSVPKMVAAVTSRVGMLSKSKTPPAGMTTATIDAAKSGLASANQMWSDAMGAAQSGDMATAAAKATQVKTQVMDLMKSLNMQMPKGAGGI